jgi:hypothetical protein
MKLPGSLLFRKETDMLKRIAMTFAMVAAASAAFESGGSLTTTGKLNIGLPAYAVVGRPLTPVSVAGVTRRTVRRCAATVAVC